MISETNSNNDLKKKIQHGQLRQRHLSTLDLTTFVGNLSFTSAATIATTTEDVSSNNNPLEVHFVHIPKTGGDSVMLDSPNHLLRGQTFQGNQEHPYEFTKASLMMTTSNNKNSSCSSSSSSDENKDKKEQEKMTVVFLREPKRHVLSQFLECKYDVWGQQVTNNTGFPGYGHLANVLEGFDDWIEHFAASKTGPNTYDTNGGGKYAYNCYDPWNMQTRYMSLGEDVKEVEAHYNKDPYHRPSLETAISNLHDSNLLVGITEHFSASMCLLEYRATNGTLLTEGCRTCTTTANLDDDTGTTTTTTSTSSSSSSSMILLADAQKQHHHESHGVPTHSINMITNATTLEYIQRLTELDRQLYEYALKTIFQKEIDDVYNATGIDLLCRPSRLGKQQGQSADSTTIGRIGSSYTSPYTATQASGLFMMLGLLLIITIRWRFFCFSEDRKNWSSDDDNNNNNNNNSAGTTMRLLTGSTEF